MSTSMDTIQPSTLLLILKGKKSYANLIKVQRQRDKGNERNEGRESVTFTQGTNWMSSEECECEEGSNSRAEHKPVTTITFLTFTLV